MTETRRRTLVKTVTWRVIGIVWTWIGAYLILVFTPDRYRSAASLSAFIVAFHHSTRMIMYYGYERLWAAIGWGKSAPGGSSPAYIPWTAKLVWTLAVLLAIVLMLVTVLYVTPMVKP